MNLWLVFWTAVMVTALGSFAVLVVVVTIGGLSDVQSLFRSIEQQHAKDRDEQGK